MAERRPRLDQPREHRSRLIPRLKGVDPEKFGVLSEKFARFMGTPQFIIWMTVFVCRPPLETPTGRYLGMVHIQRLLREPPHASIGGILDKDIEPLQPSASLGQITRLLANYNMVGLPVVDENGLLLGAVTVDDVLDHILPDDWREERHDVTDPDEVSHG